MFSDLLWKIRARGREDVGSGMFRAAAPSSSDGDDFHDLTETKHGGKKALAAQAVTG